MRTLGLCLLVGLTVLWPFSQVESALNTAQRRELKAIRRDLSRAATLLRRKKLDEAEKKIDKAEQRLEKVKTDAKLDDTNRAIAEINKLIELRRKALNKRKASVKGKKRKGDSGNNSSKDVAPIALATGNEKVSFKKDIAPFLVNICLRCHNDRQRRSGFSLASFKKLMRGGDSGQLVVAGDLDASRLWDLVGKQRPIKMPPGQARITRSNWRNLRTWILEGAKFDGGDPKASLRSLVPTEAEKRSAELAKLSPQQFAAMRKKQTVEQWKHVLRNEQPRWVESHEFLLAGNVSQTRLEQVNLWAEKHAKSLRKLFHDKSDRLFKGKLAIFVAKDRYSYEEFHFELNRRETPREVTGHSVVTLGFETAYVVLQDVGDADRADSIGMRLNLIDHLTGAFLKKSGGTLPDWIIRGTGPAIADKSARSKKYLNAVRSDVLELLQLLGKPEDVFANGTFSPSDVAAVGYSLVDFLLRSGGASKFARLIRTLQEDSDLPGAVKSVYRTNLSGLVRAYLKDVRKKRRRKRR